MSKALEIAEERLAKGEITKQEFDEIKASVKDTMTEKKEVTLSDVKHTWGGTFLVFGCLGLAAMLFVTSQGNGLNEAGSTVLIGSIVAIGLGLFMRTGKKA